MTSMQGLPHGGEVSCQAKVSPGQVAVDEPGQVGRTQLVGEVLPVDGGEAQGVQPAPSQAAKVVPQQVVDHRVRDGGGLLQLLHVHLVMRPLQPTTGGGAAVDENESFDQFGTPSCQSGKHIRSKADTKAWKLTT